MEVFRLTKEKYAGVLSGVGAAKFGNRWNSKGVEMVYTSASRALAVTEILVHLPTGLIPDDMVMLRVEVPDDLPVKVLNEKALPSNWNVFPHIVATQLLGDNFIYENSFVVMSAPSVVVPGDFNYLLNPNHVDFKRIKILSKEPFGFDVRLF